MMNEQIWVPKRLAKGMRRILGKEQSRKIVEQCGRGIGHTITMLRGAAQIADLTDGPVNLIFDRASTATHYAYPFFVEIARRMGYENVIRYNDHHVIVNGVLFRFFGPNESYPWATITYRDGRLFVGDEVAV